jgi:type IV pilus assembly protein PilE
MGTLRAPRRAPLTAGVTLMEVLITVAIVAILAAVGLPQYRKAIERNYRQQAQDLLTTIYYGERAYRLANGKFVVPVTWNDIFMDDPHVGAAPPIDYAVTAAAANTFTATATRPAGTGPCAGQTLTIDETRTIAGPWLGCP